MDEKVTSNEQKVTSNEEQFYLNKNAQSTCGMMRTLPNGYVFTLLSVWNISCIKHLFRWGE